MAIKAGQILHDANGFLVDRIQTGGVTNLNQASERVQELGNFETVATIREIPDLSFEVESLDVATELEAIILNAMGATPQTPLDFINARPVDVISPLKSKDGAFDVHQGVAIPHLVLENATYRFGVRQNAGVTFTLRGDSVYYTPGTPYLQQFAAAGTGPYAFTNPAIRYRSGSDEIFALSVTLIRADGTTKRLYFGTDYTNDNAGFTLLAAPPAGSTIRVVYASTVAATYPQSVHPSTAVKPAAVRGKDIDVYISNGAATPTMQRWTGVQGVEVTRRVNIENDEEFGNEHYVAQDYADVPEVSGNVTVRPRDLDDLYSKIHQVSGVAANEVVGPTTSVTLPMEVRISHPDTGARLKTLYVPDARFQIPTVQGRVGQKLETAFNFDSDGGKLLVYSGARP